MEKKTQIPTPPVNHDFTEIDFLDLAKKLWKGRQIVLKFILISAILGIFVAISIPNEYTAKSVLVPQLKTESSGGLSGLAAMAGINVGISQTSSEVSPILYPLIIKSIPFQLELMNAPLQFNDTKQPISILDHNSSNKTTFNLISLIKKYTIGLPSLILRSLSSTKKEQMLTGDDNQIIQLTASQKSALRELASIVTLTINSREGYVTVTARMPEALTAAQLTQKTVDLLQKYIIDFKIKKSKAELEFIEQRFNEKKIEFENAQEALATRIDRNKNFTSGLSSIETDRLQAKYTLTFGVYQELAKQLEQGKIQVKKETPVFVIIEPVTIPSDKSKPNRMQILLIWLILGGVVGTLVVLGKEYIEPIKKRWEVESNKNSLI